MTGIEKELSLIREEIQQQNDTSSKLADNFFALGNLALAGIVFTQFIPNSTFSGVYILSGSLITLTMYGIALSILRRK